MNLLITRGQEDAEPLATLLGEKGHSTLIDPLFRVSYKSVPEISSEGVQGLLVTSANGIRAFAAQNWVQSLSGDFWREQVPVYAVGDASARMARDVGFSRVYSAAGDVETLAELVCGQTEPDQGRFLHIAGTRVAGDLAGRLGNAGFECTRQVMYETKAASSLGEETRMALEKGLIDGILFYSPRTADIFRSITEKAELVVYLKGVQAYCMSMAVTSKISGIQWAGVRVAPKPDQLSMLGLIGSAE